MSWPPRPPDWIGDLLTADQEELRAHVEGAYVLILPDTARKIPYPLRRSRVFYIGKAGEGSDRLSTHQYHTSRAVADLQANGGRYFEEPWWPRYTWAAGHGGAVVWWFSRRGTQTAGDVEVMLVNAFFSRFGSIPVANGQWPS